jgi:hypothetical protein
MGGRFTCKEIQGLAGDVKGTPRSGCLQGWLGLMEEVCDLGAALQYRNY